MSALKGLMARGSRLDSFLITLYAIWLSFVSAHTTPDPDPDPFPVPAPSRGEARRGVECVLEQLIGLIDGTTYVSVSECKC